MNAPPDLAAVGVLIGEPSRAAMLASLLGGQALAAGDLAARAGVSPQAASAHLHKLVRHGLLIMEARGRHRYYRLSGPAVAHALEALGAIAPEPPVRSLRESEQTRRLRFARTCYAHLAGRLGVGLTKALVRQGVIRAADDGFLLTTAGAEWLERFGVQRDAWPRSRRKLAPSCLDWSEREPHVAGLIGAALAERCLALNWIERPPGVRAVLVTPGGKAGFLNTFGLSFL